MDGDLANARGTFSSFIIAFPETKRRTELGAKLLAQIPKKGVAHLLGSMTLNSADDFYETVVLSSSIDYVSHYNISPP